MLGKEWAGKNNAKKTKKKKNSTSVFKFIFHSEF